MTKKTFNEWMESGHYLPRPLRDFHDQKDTFKWIGEKVGISKKAKSANGIFSLIKNLPNWVDGHIYVIDYFLWFMAKCGYTLQKSRAGYDFCSLENSREDYKQRMFDEIAEVRQSEDEQMSVSDSEQIEIAKKLAMLMLNHEI